MTIILDGGTDGGSDYDLNVGLDVVILEAEGEAHIPAYLQDCVALWEVIDPWDWPSAAEPSSFRAAPEYIPAPSSYVRDPAGTTLWDLEGK